MMLFLVGLADDLIGGVQEEVPGADSGGITARGFGRMD